MKHSLGDLKPREVWPGFRGRFVHSDTMTLAYWDIDAGGIVNPHSHPHEQVVNVLEGELEMTADGKTQVLKAGDLLVIPGNVVHEGRALTKAKVLDVFSPVREDYRP